MKQNPVKPPKQGTPAAAILSVEPKWANVIIRIIGIVVRSLHKRYTTTRESYYLSEDVIYYIAMLHWIFVFVFQCISCDTVKWESLANLANHPWFTKLKPSKLVLTINNLLANLLICQTFFRQMLETSQFTKLSRYMVVTLLNLQMILIPCFTCVCLQYKSHTVNVENSLG